MSPPFLCLSCRSTWSPVSARYVLWSLPSHPKLPWPQTYGPFTRCYDQPSWTSLPLQDRAKLIARQGHSFVTAQNVRVVYPPRHENDQELIDVPKDGHIVGEIVTRGNIVMKEVGDSTRQASTLRNITLFDSTSKTRKLPAKRSGEVTSTPATLR